MSGAKQREASKPVNGATPGQQLRTLRRELKYDLETAGKRWGGVSPCTVARWERDKKIPSIPEAWAICLDTGLVPSIWLTSPLVMHPVGASIPEIVSWRS
jgi:DNA-binding XRE family transcriptional regulator